MKLENANFGIRGVIQLLSPLHVASPKEDSGDKAAGASKRNIIRTMQQPIFVDGVRMFYPYFPGNDWRGRVRRRSADIIMAAFNEKIPVDLYSGLTCLAASTSPESSLSIEEVLRANDNVFMGIWGGGLRLLRSRLQTPDLIPITEQTIAAGMVPEDYSGKPWVPKMDSDKSGPWQLKHEFDFIRIDDVDRAFNPESILQYIADPAASVAAHQAKVLASRESRSGEGTKKADLSNMMAVETIAPGVRLYSDMSFSSALNDAQVGLLIQSVIDLCNRPEGIGGWCRVGMGRYDASDLKLYRHDEVLPIMEWSEGRWVASPQVASLIEALQSALRGVTPQQMMPFFMPSKPAKDDSTKDKKAKAEKVE